jgi:hypothetical protein
VSPRDWLEFERLLAILESEGALVSTITPSGDRSLAIRPHAANDTEPARFLSLQQGAALIGTSLTALRRAIRTGAIQSFGGQRDRAVKRVDVLAWQENRKAPAIAGRYDRAIARKVARLIRARAEKGGPR